MTVQELIDKLNTIEDKSIDVCINWDGGIGMVYCEDCYIFDDHIELW